MIGSLEERLPMRNVAKLSILAAAFAVQIGFAQSATDPLDLKPSHATASVADLDRAIKWYEEMLDFKLKLRQKLNANAEIAWLVMPGYRIDLIQRKDSIRHPLPTDRMLVQGWGHVVFIVSDVDRTYAILKARGVVLPE